MLFLSRLVVVFIPDSSGVLSLLLVEEGGDPVLSPELLPRLSREVVDYLPSESDAGHGVQDDFVGDHVTYSQHFAVETCFDPVDFLSLPQASCDHRSAEVNEH